MGGSPTAYVGIAAAVWAVGAGIPLMALIFVWAMPRWPGTVACLVFSVTALAFARAVTFPTYPDGAIGYVSPWTVASTGGLLFSATALLATRLMPDKDLSALAGPHA